MENNVLTIAALCGITGFAGIEIASIDTSAERSPSPLKVELKRIGTLHPRSANEIKGSNWTIGCECLDRDSSTSRQQAWTSVRDCGGISDGAARVARMGAVRAEGARGRPSLCGGQAVPRRVCGLPPPPRRA